MGKDNHKPFLVVNYFSVREMELNARFEQLDLTRKLLKLQEIIAQTAKEIETSPPNQISIFLAQLEASLLLREFLEERVLKFRVHLMVKIKHVGFR